MLWRASANKLLRRSVIRRFNNRDASRYLRLLFLFAAGRLPLPDCERLALAAAPFFRFVAFPRGAALAFAEPLLPGPFVDFAFFAAPFFAAPFLAELFLTAPFFAEPFLAERLFADPFLAGLFAGFGFFLAAGRPPSALGSVEVAVDFIVSAALFAASTVPDETNDFPSAERLPIIAPATPPTTAPTGPAMTPPITAPVTPPAVCFETGRLGFGFCPAVCSV